MSCITNDPIKIWCSDFIKIKLVLDILHEQELWKQSPLTICEITLKTNRFRKILSESKSFLPAISIKYISNILTGVLNALLEIDRYNK